MDLSEYYGKDVGHEKLRELTDELMRRISELVDHRSNYASIEVPIPAPRRSPNIAVLLLHGFTSCADSVDGLRVGGDHLVGQDLRAAAEVALRIRENTIRLVRRLV